MDIIRVCAWIILTLLFLNFFTYPYMIQKKMVSEYTAGKFVGGIIMAIPELIIVGRILGWW